MRSELDRGVGKTVDWRLVACWVLLVIIGVMNIFATIQGEDPSSIFDMDTRSGKQIMWFGISAAVAVLVLFALSPQLWKMLSVPLYAVVVFLLFLVIFLSSDIKGSHSWFSLGPVSFQPAEVSKITTSLLLAAFMSRQNYKMSRRNDLSGTLAILLLPMAAILLENETGSMLVYVGFLFVLYREGLSGWFIFILGACILLFITTLVIGKVVALCLLGAMVLCWLLSSMHRRWKSVNIRLTHIRRAVLCLVAGVALVFGTEFAFNKILKDHQRVRIEVLLGMKEDIQGAGYNVHQSKIAIGSGGLFGKGFLNGTQTAYGFVPEQSTDFIFCTVGEEWGFLGCLFVIVVYGLLIFWIVQDAEDSREGFTRIYGYCLASCLFMHLFINVGMTIGLMPVIGIPLPYVSYGGSSLLSFTVMLFIFIALDRQEKKYF